jgi:hypothetical protein
MGQIAGPAVTSNLDEPEVFVGDLIVLSARLHEMTESPVRHKGLTRDLQSLLGEIEQAILGLHRILPDAPTTWKPVVEVEWPIEPVAGPVGTPFPVQGRSKT